MAEVCVHCVISGKVQGVFYRAACKKMAEQLNVTGWVRNSTAGKVECVLCGEIQQVEFFKQWLWQGPMLARVAEVRYEELPYEKHGDFVIRK